VTALQDWLSSRPVDPRGLKAFICDALRNLTAEESADYLAIMDLFSATLLVDLSAAEVTAQSLAQLRPWLHRQMSAAERRVLGAASWKL